MGWSRFVSVFIPIPKKGNAKECSNYRTIALISHASKVMLKILQARPQQYVNREEGWAPKNWSFWTVVLEKTLESPLDCKEIQLVHSERDQPWDFFGRNDAKAETPVLWPPHANSWLIGKDSDAGRDWGQKEKGMTEDEMAGWHRWLDGLESEWTPGSGDGQGGLACCKSWGRKESDMTERMIWSDLITSRLQEKRSQETRKKVYSKWNNKRNSLSSIYQGKIAINSNQWCVSSH